MSPRDRLISLRFDSQVLEALEENRRQFGTPVSEQIRRAVDAWLERGGVLAGVAGVDVGPSTSGRQKTARKRASTRRRA